METSLINTIPLFSGLPNDFLVDISNHSRLVNFNAGHTLLKAGDKPGYLMVVLAGRIQLNELAEDGRVIGVNLASPPDVLTWLSVIDNKPTPQTIIALSKCNLLICPISIIQNKLMNHAIFANRFLKLAAHSIRRLEQSRAMLSLPNAFHRVFVQISLLSENAQTNVSNLPKQQDIANAVNTSRETVSRALQMLIKHGVLRKVGHQIVISQADTLKKLAIDGPEAMPAN
jgi:CRP/FNR family transcriptional regulator, cyclic AMP receptor protein